MHRENNMEFNQIYKRDCLEGLREFPDKSIDCCITSPVYKDSDGFNPITLSAIFFQIHRVLKDKSLFFLNFGHLAEDKFRPFKVCEMAINRGFQLNDTITWVKNHYRPIQGKKRLNNLSEFIFLLHKGEMPELDRLAIGIPYKDKSNAKRFAGGRDLKCRGNIWEIPYETINKKEDKKHNDRFPVLLPEMCIKLSGLPKESIVIDPFMGSGTTAVAAKKLEMQYIGFEINREHYATSLKRLDETNYSS